MDNFVKYFSACEIRGLEKKINDYIEHTDNKLEVTAISIFPSRYCGYFDAIVAFRRSK